MRRPGRHTRRDLLAWSGAWAALLVPGGGRGAPEQPRDQGIGGTGAVPAGDDRGIGGTGVIGTIRRFGSIYVNGLRIAYAKDVAVVVDGEPAGAASLKLGQVVHAVARRRGGVLRTDRIEVESEVVGRVEARSAGSMTVLGQTVSLEGLRDAARWQVGERVAVAGLRRNDGVIVASLVEVRESGLAKVAGPLTRLSTGDLAIGGLRLNDVDPSLAGTRAVVFGSPDNGALAVASSRRERIPSGSGVRRVSIEAFVEHRGSGFRLGSGLDVRGRARGVPDTGSTRAIVTTNVDDRGGLRIERIRLDQRGPQNRSGEPRPADPRPDERGPLDPRRSGPDSAGSRGPRAPRAPDGGRNADPGAVPTRPRGIDMRDGPGSPGGLPSGGARGSVTRPEGFGPPGFGGPGGFGPGSPGGGLGGNPGGGLGSPGGGPGSPGGIGLPGGRR